MLSFLRQYNLVDAGLLVFVSLIHTDSQGKAFFDGESTSFPIHVIHVQKNKGALYLLSSPQPFRTSSCAKAYQSYGGGE